MILRHSLLRHGRKTSRSAAWRDLRRWISSDMHSIEQRAEQSSHNIAEIEALMNSAAAHDVKPINLKPSEPTISPTELAAQNYREFKRQQGLFDSLGAVKTPAYQQHQLVNNPLSPADVTLELLLASQCHLGHATSLWNPANAQYIFGVRDGIHIISLDVTATHLRRAAKIIEAVTAKGGLILFAGTRPGQDRCVVKAAQLSGGCHLFERWIPGSITNGQQILGNCQLKVVDEFDNEVPGFEDQLLDQPTLKPDLVVCLNPLENYVLLHECALNNIPTIGVIDTDANPTWVTYAIPANDDSLRCIEVLTGVLGRAGEAGKLRRLSNALKKNYDFAPANNLNVPGHLGKAKKEYPAKIMLGGTIQELEEQDRGITYDYKLDGFNEDGKAENKSEGEGEGEKTFRTTENESEIIGG